MRSEDASSEFLPPCTAGAMQLQWLLRGLGFYARFLQLQLEEYPEAAAEAMSSLQPFATLCRNSLPFLSPGPTPAHAISLPAVCWPSGLQ